MKPKMPTREEIKCALLFAEKPSGHGYAFVLAQAFRAQAEKIKELENVITKCPTIHTVTRVLKWAGIGGLMRLRILNELEKKLEASK